ncbi:hypothetical protein C8R48DRAFT_435483 [Suillus tomentosus]|nr:hypothetical protein C8R48DRAFT_435483 [Suillus tomentosus]
MRRDAHTILLLSCGCRASCMGTHRVALSKSPRTLRINQLISRCSGPRRKKMHNRLLRTLKIFAKDKQPSFCLLPTVYSGEPRRRHDDEEDTKNLSSHAGCWSRASPTRSYRDPEPWQII